MRVSNVRIRRLTYAGTTAYLVWFFLVLGGENSFPFLRELQGIHFFSMLLLVSLLFATTLAYIEHINQLEVK